MDTRSTGEVVASLIVNAQAMIAKEVELVGLELRRMIGRKIAAVVLLLVGALALFSVLLLGAATAAIALEDVLDERWMAWGAVTLVAAVLALVLVAVAGRLLSASWSPRSQRRDTTSTGVWLRALGDELTGSSTPDTPPATPDSGGADSTGAQR
jgi:protein-S-isoprenylcysteine O-methyltransferase Ste14